MERLSPAARALLAATAVVAAAFWSPVSAQAATPSSGYHCLGSVGGHRLDGPSNDGVPGEWVQGDGTNSWLIGCSYPVPGGQWAYEVAWTPTNSSDQTFEGCGSKPTNPTSGFVSPDHWAYSSTNIDNPPPELAAAAQGQLHVVEQMAKLCAHAATALSTTTVLPTTTNTTVPATTTAPPAPSTTGASASDAPSRATISNLVGSVEVKLAGSANFVEASPGTVLHEGDFVSTGFDSAVTLTFDYGVITVYPMTQLRIDSYVNQANFQRTQLYLKIGSVQATVRHTAAIRGDFHVTTQYANASVRGSVMVVSVATDGATRVFTTEDQSSVQGVNDSAPVTIPLNQSSEVGPAGHASAPLAFSASALPLLPGGPDLSAPRSSPARSSSTPAGLWVLVGIGGVGLVGLGVLVRRRRSNPQTA